MHHPVDRIALAVGAVLAATGVGLGAFAAHGLRAVLAPAQLGWWQTAVQYQMWHAVGLLAVALIPRARPAALMIASGTLLFSGSLYVMALTGARFLGMVTPVGGALMIAGWLTLLWYGARPATPERL